MFVLAFTRVTTACRSALKSLEHGRESLYTTHDWSRYVCTPELYFGYPQAIGKGAVGIRSLLIQ